MIYVYPSHIEGSPLERHKISAPITIAEWCRRNIAGFVTESCPRINVIVNGRDIPGQSWELFIIQPDDRVTIAPRPGISGTTALVIATVVSVAASYFLRPSVPNMNSAATYDAQELYGANTRANTAKRDAVIPEITGRVRRYGDYVTPQHKYYADRRTQWVEFMMLIGVGEYEIKPEEVFIGDTPAISLGDDFSYEIFPPGADVSGNSASEHWHSATEVGNTSTGGGGLDLTTTVDLTKSASPDRYRAAGRTLTPIEGSLPEDWQSGIDVVVRYSLPYDFFKTDSGQIGIRGDNLDSIGAYEGMSLQITGENAGTFVVDRVVAAVPEQSAIDPDPNDPDDTGSPAEPAQNAYLTLKDRNGNAVTWLETGIKTAAIGLTGYVFRVTAVDDTSITVERQDSNAPANSEWSGWGNTTSNAADIVLDASSYYGDWTGWFSACPSNETTTRSQVSIYWPQGLFHTKSSGSVSSKTSGIEIQWRDRNDPNREIHSQEQWFEASSRDPIGETVDIYHGSAVAPEVRIRALPVDHDENRDQIKMQWSGLCSQLRAPTSYDGATTMAIRVRGGQRLSSQSESQANVVCTRKLPPLDNPDGDLVATRNIAPWIAYVLDRAGYERDDIDIDELTLLHRTWTSRGEYIDRTYSDEITVADVIEEAMIAGFSRMRNEEGLLQPIRDEKRETVQPLMFGPQSMFEELERTFTAPDADDTTGIDVTYQDGATGSTGTVRCRIPGITANKIESLTLDQISDRTHAWRIGMRRLLEYHLRRWSNRASSGLAGLNANILDLVELADDVPGYEQTGFLERVEAARDGRVLLTLSEPIEWTSNDVHVIKVMGSNGRRAAVKQAYPTGNSYQVLCEPLGVDLDLTGRIDLPHIFFGTVERSGRLALINSVEFDGDLVGDEEPTSTIVAENYHEGVYQYDDSLPPDDE